MIYWELAEGLNRAEKIDWILNIRGITKSKANDFIINEYSQMSDSEIDIEFEFYSGFVADKKENQ